MQGCCDQKSEKQIETSYQTVCFCRTIAGITKQLENKRRSQLRTGLHGLLDTLRVWEPRYDLVRPMRSEGGGRLYSREDVTRRSVIKRLVDGGHAIGTSAELSMQQLRQRLADTRLIDRSFAVKRPVPMAILDATLPLRFQADLEL